MIRRIQGQLAKVEPSAIAGICSHTEVCLKILQMCITWVQDVSAAKSLSSGLIKRPQLNYIGGVNQQEMCPKRCNQWFHFFLLTRFRQSESQNLAFLNHLADYFLPQHAASILLFHLTPHPFRSQGAWPTTFRTYTETDRHLTTSTMSFSQAA